MNAKKAKKIRKAIGFNPNAKREYKRLSTHSGILNPKVSYTVVSTGLRRLYKILKKSLPSNADPGVLTPEQIKEFERIEGVIRQLHEEKA